MTTKVQSALVADDEAGVRYYFVGWLQPARRIASALVGLCASAGRFGFELQHPGRSLSQDVANGCDGRFPGSAPHDILAWLR
jgi:hypothetical protein